MRCLALLFSVWTCVVCATARASQGVPLVLSFPHEVVSFDPLQASSEVEIAILHETFEGLTRWDGQNLVTGAAAMEVSDDGLTYRFTIYKEAVWSDRSAVTGEDFMRAFRRVFSSRSSFRVAAELGNVVNAREVMAGQPFEKLGISANGRVIEIRLIRPDNGLLAKLAHRAFLPIHAGAPAPDDQTGWKQYRPKISNGPYRLNVWVPGDRLELVQNRERQAMPRPNYSRLVYRFISDPATSLAAVRAGIVNVAQVHPEYSLPSRAELTTHTAPRAGTCFLAIDPLSIEKLKPWETAVRTSPEDELRLRDATFKQGLLVRSLLRSVVQTETMARTLRDMWVRPAGFLIPMTANPRTIRRSLPAAVDAAWPSAGEAERTIRAQAEALNLAPTPMTGRRLKVTLIQRRGATREKAVFAVIREALNATRLFETREHVVEFISRDDPFGRSTLPYDLKDGVNVTFHCVRPFIDDEASYLADVAKFIDVGKTSKELIGGGLLVDRNDPPWQANLLNFEERLGRMAIAANASDREWAGTLAAKWLVSWQSVIMLYQPVEHYIAGIKVRDVRFSDNDKLLSTGIFLSN